MKKKTTKKKLKLFLFAGFAIPAILVILAYFHLARLLQIYGLPLASEYVPISNFTAKVSRADFDGLRLTSVSVSEKGESGLQLDDITFSLSGAKLAKLEIEGLRLNSVLRNGRLTLPGFDGLFSNAAFKRGTPVADSAAATRGFSIPYVAENASIDVRRSEMCLTSIENGRKIVSRIPYSLTVNRSGNDARFAARVGPVDFMLRGVHVKIPSFSAYGTAKLADDVVLCRIAAEFSGAEFTAGKLRISGVRGKIPLSFLIENGTLKLKSAKLADYSDAGSLSADEIAFDKFPPASLAISTSRSKKTGNFIVSGAVRSGLLGENTISLSGECVPPTDGGALSVEMSAKLKIDDFSTLLSVVPTLSDWRLNGGMIAKASARLARGVLTTSAGVKLENVSASNEKSGISVEKASLDFALDDCLALKSRPSQKLVFENLKAGDFLLKNGMAVFQLESSRTIFFERIILGWCGGNVDVNAFRMAFDHPEDIDAILYCDRLNIAELLNQIHIAEAKGNGNVSGRIPLTYSGGKITIRKGFLYSTPGVGGHMALTDFIGPLASLPATIQLDITREALKDFNYDWIKLDLNSKGEDLLLKLALKGAPAKSLPFTYDKKNGGLRRSDNAKNTAKFQGISFNLNFKLPANQLMSVGRKIKEMTEK